MMILYMPHHSVKSNSCQGSVGKWRCPRPINRHASSRPQAVRAHGAPRLLFGFAWKSSLSVPWARGLLSVFWIWGYPDLPARGPPRGSIDGLVRPSPSIDNSRPWQGAKPREADNAKTSKVVSLLRLAPEERRFLCKVHLASLS